MCLLMNRPACATSCTPYETIRSADYDNSLGNLYISVHKFYVDCDLQSLDSLALLFSKETWISPSRSRGYSWSIGDINGTLRSFQVLLVDSIFVDIGCIPLLIMTIVFFVRGKHKKKKI